MFENVQGLTRAAFADYFAFILMQLEFPSLTAKPKEQWGTHLARLRNWKNKPGAVGEYQVRFKLVNAANYGVPQKRARVLCRLTRGRGQAVDAARRDAQRRRAAVVAMGVRKTL